MSQETPKRREKCDCGVPHDVHGTMCGWYNAKITVNNDGLIMDKAHPEYGKDYNQWMNSRFTGSDPGIFRQARDMQVTDGAVAAYKERLREKVNAIRNKVIDWPISSAHRELIAKEYERIIELIDETP